MAGVEEVVAEKGDASKEDSEEQTLGQLMKRCNKAREELYSLLANPVVVDITRTKVEDFLLDCFSNIPTFAGWSYEWQVYAGYKREKDEGDITETGGKQIKNFSLRDILLDCQVEQLQLAMLKLETNKPGRRFTLSSP